MPVRRIAANQQVAADKGRVALQRGPIVYCAEWPDNPNGHVRNLMLPDDSSLAAEFKPNLLNGVAVIKGRAVALAHQKDGAISKTSQDFTAIPYCVWANRGPGEMTVWIPDNEASARPLPLPTIATTSKVTVSGRKDPRAINDGEEPISSGDYNSHFDWWPKKGTTEWVEYAFEKPATVSESEVYWFDDTGVGECRVPAGWRILYKKDGQWTPIENTGGYGVDKDRYNRVTFRSVLTSGLRLEVTAQPAWAAGILEWKVK